MKHPALTPSLGTVRAWLDGIGDEPPSGLFIYHRGHLAFDRGQWAVGVDGQPIWVIAEEVDAVARLLWQAHERGEVVLTQRRMGPKDWLYVAQRSLWLKRRRQADD